MELSSKGVPFEQFDEGFEPPLPREHEPSDAPYSAHLAAPLAGRVNSADPGNRYKSATCPENPSIFKGFSGRV